MAPPWSIVKFNDYQCPPCRQTYMEYKPIFAKWAKQAPGKVKFITKDFALERECNVGGQQRRPPGGVRGGGRRPPRAREGQGRGDGGVDLRQPAGS